MNVTTDLQAFGLIVTAEPYFSVTHPSNEIVAENVILPGTKGFEETSTPSSMCWKAAEYTIDVPADQLPSARSQGDVPSICWKPRRSDDRQSRRSRTVRLQQHPEG